jgi:hypothetical protein
MAGLQGNHRSTGGLNFDVIFAQDRRAAGFIGYGGTSGAIKRVVLIRA